MPRWVISGHAQDIEGEAFLSGGGLGALHLALSLDTLPQTLFRERLSLRAAEACTVFSGRPERLRDLRDAFTFLRTGDLPGPAGEVYQAWRHAVARPVSIKALHRALPTDAATQIADWLDAGARQGGWCAPVGQAAAVLEAVLTDRPRADVQALILADAALALALGWGHVVPLLAAGLKRGDMRKRGDALRHACHRAVTASTIEAVRLSADLLRRAARLTAVAPMLRAKGAQKAVEIFLARDAVAPSGLPLPDRAARRLCDRLVELDVVRELTGRDSFRLYGI